MSAETLLPEEIASDIMLRLPVKSIIRCKAWNRLLNSSAFIDSHLSRNNVHDILLIREEYDSYSLYRDSPCAQYVELPYPSKYVAEFKPFYYSRKDRTAVGTCNGLICLAGRSDSSYSHVLYMQDVPIIIWNPTVRRIVILPKPSIIAARDARQIHAFGYDSRNNDYKVLRIVTSRGEHTRTEIYAPSRGSWMVLGLPACFNLPPPSSGFNLRSSFVNGASHWLQICKKKQVYRIVSFDMATESLGEVPVPGDFRENKPYRAYISEYEELLP